MTRAEQASEFARNGGHRQPISNLAMTKEHMVLGAWTVRPVVIKRLSEEEVQAMLGKRSDKID